MGPTTSGLATRPWSEAAGQSTDAQAMELWVDQFGCESETVWDEACRENSWLEMRYHEQCHNCPWCTLCAKWADRGHFGSRRCESKRRAFTNPDGPLLRFLLEYYDKPRVRSSASTLAGEAGNAGRFPSSPPTLGSEMPPPPPPGPPPGTAEGDARTFPPQLTEMRSAADTDEDVPPPPPPPPGPPPGLPPNRPAGLPPDSPASLCHICCCTNSAATLLMVCCFAAAPASCICCRRSVTALCSLQMRFLWSMETEKSKLIRRFSTDWHLLIVTIISVWQQLLAVRIEEPSHAASATTSKTGVVLRRLLWQ